MKHYHLFPMLLLCVVAILTGCAGVHKTDMQPSQGAVYTVNVDAFAEKLTQPKMLLVDVRTPAEYAQGHLRGALNVDMHRADFEDQIPSGRPLAFYCRSGKRSLEAAQKMAARGAMVYDLQGGILAWQAAGREVTLE